jgi:hypothetical protein
MALSIKDNETDLLVRRLAKVTGEDYTKTIKHAVWEKLTRLTQDEAPSDKKKRFEQLQAFLDARKPVPPKGYNHKKFTDALWET